MYEVACGTSVGVVGRKCFSQTQCKVKKFFGSKRGEGCGASAWVALSWEVDVVGDGQEEVGA